MRNEAMRYYDKSRNCPKCDSWSPTDSYIGTHDGVELAEDYIQRTCKNCGYFWNERPRANHGVKN